MLDPGTRIGDLEVVTILGVGTSAVVYLVREAKTKAQAALKVLHTNDPVAVTRLLKEGKTLAQLDHPNVVQSYRGMTVDGRPALLMERVEGPPLGRWLDGFGAPGIEEGLELFKAIARGVSALHAVGLIHRDLNPGNVLLSVAGPNRVIPKIIDLGLVRPQDQKGTPGTGAPVGTASYMAPEQATDPSGVDARADVFSLGCILYELMTGEQAFPGNDPVAVRKAAGTQSYLRATTVRDEVPDHIDALIHRMLSPDPSNRPESIEVILEEIFLDDVEDVASDTREKPESFARWSVSEVSTEVGAAVRRAAPEGKREEAKDPGIDPTDSAFLWRWTAVILFVIAFALSIVLILL